MDGRLFDPEQALGHARALAFPRLVATEGEARAVSYIGGVWGALGVPFLEEPFGFSRTPWLLMRTALFCSAVTLLTAGAVYSENPEMAFFCAALPLGLGAAARAGLRRLLSQAVRADGSGAVNLVGGPVGEGPLRIVLMAHHDSKGQGISLPLRMFAFGLLFLGSLSLCTAFGWASVSGGIVGSWVAPGCGISAAAALVLAGLGINNRSPGALDNASGVGTLLELARVISAAPYRGVEVEFVCTGAEEVGLMGAYAFLQRRRNELLNSERPVSILNLDGVGAGRRIWVSGKKRKGQLLEDLRRAARRCSIGVLGPRPLIGMLADHVPFEGAGIEAMTLSGLSSKLLAIHTVRDGADKLEAEAMKRAGTLVLETLAEAERRALTDSVGLSGL